MFGNFASFAGIPSKNKIDPKDVPPPTPVTLPRFQPFAHDDDPVDAASALSSLLQNTGRTTAALGAHGFSAIGLNLNLDAKPADLVPDPSYIPDFDEWDRLSLSMRLGTRMHLLAGPSGTATSLLGVRFILSAKRSCRASTKTLFEPCGDYLCPRESSRLAWEMHTSSSVVLKPSLPSGMTLPSLRHCPHPLKPPRRSLTERRARVTRNKWPPRRIPGPPITGPVLALVCPPDYRNNLMTAFVKLVAYDFGCNVSPSRTEPRLHLSSPEGTPSRKTYCPSGCLFVFQSPTTREAARAGVVHGPVASVSARGTTDFTVPDPETAQSLDLAREIVAALITAQHRAREGKTEKRFGDGQWWTTEKRWGGGPGGPIGREIEKDSVQGDKDVKPSDENGLPVSKKPRKNMSIYDNYRMVRPPSSTWDKKAQYEAIGRRQGADYDDIFVVSSLFHHVSILRVRVPNRLLEALDGARELDPSKRSWGKVEAWRSPWYDLFDIKQRLEALKLVWGMMAYQMRKETGSDEDVSMTNA
ncbi:hypothetical protein FSOLCH5_006895 [Fusarium solani]